MAAEEKTCPRCKVKFMCMANDITNCQCSGVSITEQASKVLHQYRDCICINCIKEINEAFVNKKA